MGAKMEGERLLWAKNNQKTLRVEQYAHLRDAVLNGGEDPADLGTCTILPSTFVGSPRYMHERAQDAMRYVQKFGRSPDLFTTMTCNPQWKEIQRELYPGQSAHERQEIVARVFNLKVKKKKELLYKKGVYGRRVAHVHTIEWQKKG